MHKKNQEYFYLPPKEELAMKVLWDTEDALSASEIAEGIPNRDWPATSIQSILRNPEKRMPSGLTPSQNQTRHIEDSSAPLYQQTNMPQCSLEDITGMAGQTILL